MQEVIIGDIDAVERRLAVLKGIPLVEATDQARELARTLVFEGAIPDSAKGDAAHIAIAAANGIEYLMTWNCRHIANAEMRPRIEACIRTFGCEPPILCTPEEMMGD